MARPLGDLSARDLNYDAPGSTRPGDPTWPGRPTGYRTFERTVSLGSGDARWRAVSSAVLAWGVKTRSGFTVQSSSKGVGALSVGDRVWLLASVGPVTIREPAEVTAVVAQAKRVGFAYGTLEGHPVSGEEAFIVHRSADGEVWLTLRSLTRAPKGWWRLAFPGVLVAQRVYRRRYQRSLLGLDHL